MRQFELDIDEDQVRRLVKVVIDKYEQGIRAHGSYQRAVEDTQDETLESLENVSELCETHYVFH